MERVWRSTWMPQANKCGDALGDHEHSSLEMQLGV